MQDEAVSPLPTPVSGGAEMESGLLAPERGLFRLFSALWNI